MNLRPSGYEPDELPGCSTPRQRLDVAKRVFEACPVGLAGLAATDSPVP